MKSGYMGYKSDSMVPKTPVLQLGLYKVLYRKSCATMHTGPYNIALFHM